MAIQVSCQCGKQFAVADEHAGRRFKCPACGAVVTAGVPAQPIAARPVATQPVATQPVAPGSVAAPGSASQPLQYAAYGGVPGGQITPPPAELVRPPDALLPKFRYPGSPPCHLVFLVDGAVVNCNFDSTPALMALAKGFAISLKKKFDVTIGPPAGPGMPTAYVRIVTLDQGNRWLRYFFAWFAGGTTFEIEGNVVGPSGRNQPFNFKHRGRIGLFGGDSLSLMKTGGTYLGKKVGKKLKSS